MGLRQLPRQFTIELGHAGFIDLPVCLKCARRTCSSGYSASRARALLRALTACKYFSDDALNTRTQPSGTTYALRRTATSYIAIHASMLSVASVRSGSSSLAARSRGSGACNNLLPVGSSSLIGCGSRPLSSLEDEFEETAEAQHVEHEHQ